MILLHGLARRPASMSLLAAVLGVSGFRVCNLGYPSTRHPVEVLAQEHLLPKITACQQGQALAPHVVTHSLGGIVLRALKAREPALPIGRVVMLGPPNHGSEIVDRFGAWWLFSLINGPAGRQLGTGPGSILRDLGPAPFELGVIAGNRSFLEPFRWLVPAPGDGKVSVASTRLEGMQDHCELPVGHMRIMRNPMVIAQTLHFLLHGRFRKSVDSKPEWPKGLMSPTPKR